VSLLWPDPMIIGLFPGECWLKQGRLAQRTESSNNVSIESVLNDVATLLADAPVRKSRFACADVYLSDSFARTTLMPWQGSLETEEQIRAYGQACLEAPGFPVDESSAVHSGFRWHGSPGMVTAISIKLIESLCEMLGARGIKLRSVMPVSSAAYWHHAPKRGSAPVLLLGDAKRFTAFVYGGSRIVAMDVEPMLGQSHDSGKRLLNRLRLSGVQPSTIECWLLKNDLGIEPGDRYAMEGTLITSLKKPRWGYE